jgi:hypothetical protein
MASWTPAALVPPANGDLPPAPRDGAKPSALDTETALSALIAAREAMLLRSEQPLLEKRPAAEPQADADPVLTDAELRLDERLQAECAKVLGALAAAQRDAQREAIDEQVRGVTEHVREIDLAPNGQRTASAPAVPEEAAGAEVTAAERMVLLATPLFVYATAACVARRALDGARRLCGYKRATASP